MMQVEEVMYQEDEIPLVEQDSDMKDVLIEMTEKGLGITGVLDEDERLVGCVTDGDLRRVLNQSESGFFEFELTQVMTRNPLTVKTETDAVNALRIMEENEVTVLFVENDHDTPVGVVHLHDLVQEGLAEEEDELPERSSSIDLGSFLFLNVPFAAEVPLLTCFEMSLGCVA